LGDKDKRKEYDLYGDPEQQQQQHQGFHGGNPFVKFFCLFVLFVKSILVLSV
jgi:DnaJ-class molecular chaperone